MQYKTEKLSDLTTSQELLAELFIYIGENHSEAYLSEKPYNFFRLWGGNDPTAKIKVFTARDEQSKVQGCVMVLMIANPLFVGKPFIEKLVNLTNNDKAFEDYVNVILESM